jgi:5'-methylthioadenosine phosphorylase
MDVIGMTNAQEARLAREAELCYATVALVTDYDCWHPDHDHVRIEDVLRIMKENTQHAQAALAGAVSLPAPVDCACQRALDNAVITQRKVWPEETYHRLRPLLERVEDASGGTP